MFKKMSCWFLFQCPFLLEAYEHLIEKFWFHSGLEKDGRAFYKFFCVENVKGMMYRYSIAWFSSIAVLVNNHWKRFKN